MVLITQALKAAEENESRTIEAERRADALAVKADDLDEGFNTQHMMELSSVYELQVRVVCIVITMCIGITSEECLM